MTILLTSIQKSINQIDTLLDGWTFGILVNDVTGKAYLQLETGDLIAVPAGAILEVKNGSQWIPVSGEMLQTKTREGWPAYAGLEARVR